MQKGRDGKAIACHAASSCSAGKNTDRHMHVDRRKRIYEQLYIHIYVYTYVCIDINIHIYVCMYCSIISYYVLLY